MDFLIGRGTLWYFDNLVSLNDAQNHPVTLGAEILSSAMNVRTKALPPDRTRSGKSVGLGCRRSVELLAAARIDPGPLLKQAGLAGLDPTNRDLRVHAAAEARFIELAARAADSDAFGLRMAEAGDPRDLGLLFYLFNASATLRQAVPLLARYFTIVNSSLQPFVSFSPEADAIVTLTYVGLERSPLRHVAEYNLAVIVRLLRAIAGRPVNPALATFTHPRSFGIPVVERYFSCPVQFGAAADRLDFSKETLDIPIVGADERLFAILKPYCDRMAAQRRGQAAPLRATVETEILRLLPRGDARIDAVADALGASSRSLSRRLAKEDVTFSGLLEDLRRSLSLQYLSDPNLRTDQIAALLGYGDAASFSHAFRRWTGVSPARVRADPRVRSRVQGGGAP